MLYRKAIDYLIEWKTRSVRMPLVIRGARQVGKSCLVEMFAKNKFDNCIEINLEKDSLSRLASLSTLHFPYNFSSI